VSDPGGNATNATGQSVVVSLACDTGQASPAPRTPRITTGPGTGFLTFDSTVVSSLFAKASLSSIEQITVIDLLLDSDALRFGGQYRVSKREWSRFARKARARASFRDQWRTAAEFASHAEIAGWSALVGDPALRSCCSVTVLLRDSRRPAPATWFEPGLELDVDALYWLTSAEDVVDDYLFGLMLATLWIALAILACFLTQRNARLRRWPSVDPEKPPGRLVARSRRPARGPNSAQVPTVLPIRGEFATV